MSPQKPPSIGIDLGTTNSCVAVWRNGKVDVIANDVGKRTTPSCVAFSDIESYVGQPALIHRAKNPNNMVYDVKRLLGRRFDDQTVQEDMKRWPFKVIEKEGRPWIQVKYMNEMKTYAPEEISAMVLMKMKETADRFLGCDVRDAVITVPAYFNNAQRQATLDAGKIAGLNVLRLMNEPTAAALAYSMDVTGGLSRKVLIYDFGGGTFDVSIIAIHDGPKVEVLSTAGDSHLGGSDFDQLLVKHFAEKFKTDNGIDVTETRALSNLRNAAEEAKVTLSNSLKAEIFVQSLMNNINLDTTLSRAKFEHLSSGFVNSTLSHVKDALTQASLKKEDIDEVVLVGGTTRIPKVKQLLQEFFVGTSIRETINPDEAVAYGAAVQAAIMCDETNVAFNDLASTDITSLSIGISDSDGEMCVVVPRNTRIPCEISCTRITIYDNQTDMVFKLYEGEKTIAKDNHFLDTFTLTDIPPSPAEEGEALVTFTMNDNGILKVTAVEKITGKSNSILISMREKGLPEAEVKRMIEEIENKRLQEARKRERTDAKNQLEQYSYKVMSAVSDSKNNLGVEEKKRAMKRCNETILWLEDHEEASRQEFEEKLDELQTLCKSMKIKL